jgi:hypothetical protein
LDVYHISYAKENFSTQTTVIRLISSQVERSGGFSAEKEPSYQAKNDIQLASQTSHSRRISPRSPRQAEQAGR